MSDSDQKTKENMEKNSKKVCDSQTFEKRYECACSFKEKGNSFFRKKSYLEAIKQYEQGLEQVKIDVFLNCENEELIEKSRILYINIISNLIICYYKIRNFEKLKILAESCIELIEDGNEPEKEVHFLKKIYFHRSSCFIDEKNPYNALEDIERCLDIEPKYKRFIAQKEKILKLMEERERADQRFFFECANKPLREGLLNPKLEEKFFELDDGELMKKNMKKEKIEKHQLNKNTNENYNSKLKNFKDPNSIFIKGQKFILLDLPRDCFGEIFFFIFKFKVNSIKDFFSLLLTCKEFYEIIHYYTNNLIFRVRFTKKNPTKFPPKQTNLRKCVKRLEIAIYLENFENTMLEVFINSFKESLEKLRLVGFNSALVCDDNLMNALGNCTRINELSFFKCTGITEEGGKNFSKLYNLKSLEIAGYKRISNCNLFSQLPKSMIQIKISETLLNDSDLELLLVNSKIKEFEIYGEIFDYDEERVDMSTIEISDKINAFLPETIENLSLNFCCRINSVNLLLKRCVNLVHFEIINNDRISDKMFDLFPETIQILCLIECPKVQDDGFFHLQLEEIIMKE